MRGKYLNQNYLQNMYSVFPFTLSLTFMLLPIPRSHLGLHVRKTLQYTPQKATPLVSYFYKLFLSQVLFISTIEKPAKKDWTHEKKMYVYIILTGQPMTSLRNRVICKYNQEKYLLELSINLILHLQNILPYSDL